MGADGGSKRGLRHIGALDGLRGVAVAGVLVFHGGHLRGGYLGVDLFFVLSGFLITLLLLTEWGGTGRIGLGHFWARRARRLFPALVMLLVAVGLYARYVAAPGELTGIRADGFATLCYVANWHAIFSGHAYFQAGLAPSPLEHTWSLAIEEQFYVVWPLVVLGLLRLRNRPSTILRAAVAIGVGSAGLMVVLHAAGVASDNSLYLGTHTRVGSIAMGAALAAWQVSRGHTTDHRTRLGLEWLAGASIAFLAVMWSRTDLGTGLVYSGGLALCGLAVTAIIASATHPHELVVNRALSLAPLRWLGMISYGLYLFHWPTYLVLDEGRTGLSGWPLLALQATASICVATLSYLLVERPIRYGAVTGSVARVAVPVGAALACLALVVGTVGALAPITDSSASASLTSAGGSSPTLLLVGDSVPHVIGLEGVSPLAAELHVTVANGGRLGCTPLMADGPVIKVSNGGIDPTKSDCTTNYPTLVKRFRPDVVLLMYGTLFNYGIRLDGRTRDQCDPLYEKRSIQVTERDIDVLSSGGAPVVLVTAPGITDPAMLRLFKVPDSMRRSACANATLRKIVAADHRTRLVDLASFVCPPGRPCRDQVQGVKFRPDGIHPRLETAKYVARWLIPRVLAAARQPPG